MQSVLSVFISEIFTRLPSGTNRSRPTLALLGILASIVVTELTCRSKKRRKQAGSREHLQTPRDISKSTHAGLLSQETGEQVLSPARRLPLGNRLLKPSWFPTT